MEQALIQRLIQGILQLIVPSGPYFAVVIIVVIAVVHMSVAIPSQSAIIYSLCIVSSARVR